MPPRVSLHLTKSTIRDVHDFSLELAVLSMSVSPANLMARGQQGVCSCPSPSRKEAVRTGA